MRMPRNMANYLNYGGNSARELAHAYTHIVVMKVLGVPLSVSVGQSTLEMHGQQQEIKLVSESSKVSE